MKYPSLFFLFLFILSECVYSYSITIIPDEDSVTNSWTSTPLWSKIDDDIDSPDGTVITSPSDPSSTDAINFTLTNLTYSQVDNVNLRLRARRSSGDRSVSLNISWFNATNHLIVSFDTGVLGDTLSDYSSGTITVSLTMQQVNDSYAVIIPAASGGSQASAIDVDGLNLDLTASNTVLKVNGTLDDASILTGEYTLFNASCEANGLEPAHEVQLVLQNSTDNVTFTTITTGSNEPIFANASNYSIGTLSNTNSSVFTFVVNVTKAGVYTLRAQCNSTSASDANTTGANLTVNQAYGYINVSLIKPFSEMMSNVAQNRTFRIIANATCMAENPTAVCAMVNGTARYNHTTDNPLAQINETLGDVPLWTTGNQTCGYMNYSNVCSLNWTVNATGDIGSLHEIDVLFTSSQADQNDTADANITITACAVDFTLHFSSVIFGSQKPSTNQNPAAGNLNDEYNISINPGSCATDLYIRGSTNLTNDSYPTTIIGIGNVTWSNVSNTYSTSANLTEYFVPIILNAFPVVNVTTWYWLNAPPVFAGIYNGTITIAGVKNGDVI